MLVVGSTALQKWGVSMGRKPRDLDLIATREEVNEVIKREGDHIKKQKVSKNKHVLFMDDDRIIEFEIDCGFANPTAGWLLKNYAGSDRVVWKDPYGFEGVCVNPDTVYTLKLSHRYLKNNPHFRKTMDDIMALRGMGCDVPGYLKDWLKDRSKATYDYGHPKLNQTKGSFFSNDGVNYKYEHDDIHAALATLTMRYPTKEPRIVPAYSFFQAEGADVKVDREKWNFLPENTKLMSVLEESYVLALERSQIPFDFRTPPRTSFLMALEKVCTSITSGWWREYAWENYYQVLAMYSDDYVLRFKEALADGRIRAYNKEAA